VYSFSIVWQRIKGLLEPLPEIEIWATDMNPVYLDKARAGTYSRSSVKEVPEQLLARYFMPGPRQRSYTINDSLKKGIVWQVHNLLVDPPRSGFQVVFLRNSILTYYQDELKVPAFENVVDSLDQDGFLVIGTHEKIPSEVQGLLPSPLHPCIFRNSSPQRRKGR
jgi:chemotaxis protein methyltransferase CheR